MPANINSIVILGRYSLVIITLSGILARWNKPMKSENQIIEQSKQPIKIEKLFQSLLTLFHSFDEKKSSECFAVIFSLFISSMTFKVIIIVKEFMFLGINIFWARLRAHFNPHQTARAKMSLSRAQNIYARELRAFFIWLSKVITLLRLVRFVTGLKDSRQFFNRWESKPKTMYAWITESPWYSSFNNSFALLYLKDDPPPSQNMESSLEESVPGEVIAEFQPLSFQIVEGGTKRRKTSLIDSLGFSYNVHSQQPYATYWQCTVRPKKAIPARRQWQNGTGHLGLASKVTTIQ